MKKIYFALLAVLGLSLNAEAQRTIKVTLTVKYPSLDTNLTSTITVRPQYVIKNVSATAADSICKGDTLYFRTPANTLSSGATPYSGIIFGGSLKKGDSIILNKATVTGTGTDYEMTYSQIETLVDLAGTTLVGKTSFVANTQYLWYFQMALLSAGPGNPALATAATATNTNNMATVRVWNKKATSINEFSADNTVKTFPNPAVNTVSFESSFSGKATASIVDLSGRVISSKEIETIGRVDLDVSSLQTGMYFLRVDAEDNTFISKFNVQK